MPEQHLAGYNYIFTLPSVVTLIITKNIIKRIKLCMNVYKKEVAKKTKNTHNKKTCRDVFIYHFILLTKNQWHYDSNTG